MATSDIHLDVATAQRLVAPADPSLRVSAVAALTGGQNSAVFQIDTEDGTSLVIKVYSDTFHWKMQKELFVYGQLQADDVSAPVPTILASDDTRKVLPQNVLIMTKLEGVHLLSILDHIDADALVDLNRQIGSILRALHEVAFDSFGYVGTDGIVEPHPTNFDYMTLQFEKKAREFVELGGDRSLVDGITRYVAEREELFRACSRAAFCHNDCHYGNVLVLPEDGTYRVSGLLDFENVLAGDPLLDLAKTYCYAPRPTKAELAALVEGSGIADSGWREAIDLYVLYHLLELWDWFASQGPQDSLADIARSIASLIT